MKRRELLMTAFLGITGVGVAKESSAKDTPLPAVGIGKPAPSFELPDTANHPRKLAEFSGRLVVLEWTSPSCPFVRAQYESRAMPQLQQWAAAQGVVWLSVLSTHPARPDYLAPDKAEAFNKSRGAVPTALLLNANGVVGRAYGARTTPHMFVIDRAGLLAYAGAIDDHPTVDEAEVPRSRNLVKAALEDLLAKRGVATPNVRSYGCAVGYGA